jgi:dolichol-phosphate mannosyltransferase
MSKILIFTATYNEIENIEKLVTEVNKYCGDAEILIIDDNSPDGTGALLKNLEIQVKNLKVIIREGKLGLDTAHKLAFDYCKKNNYDKLITMDADFSHEPKEIQKFISLLDKNNFIIGSRYIKGGKCEMTWYRLLLSFFGNKLIRLVLNIRCNEFTTSFRGFNLKKLHSFDMNKISSKGYSFFMETVFQIHKIAHIKEIPIHFKNRKFGKSKIPKAEILRTLKNLFYLKFFK